MQHVIIAHNGDTSLRHYHTENCASIANAKNTEQITKAHAKQIGLDHCSQCDGPEQPESHDTRHIDALRAAGGDD